MKRTRAAGYEDDHDNDKGFREQPRDVLESFQLALRHKEQVMALGAQQRHQKFMQDYTRFYKKSPAVASASTSQASESTRSDFDVVRKHHRFIRTVEDDCALEEDWERRVAKRYYDRLYKEYVLVELRRCAQRQLAMRWRTEKEVLRGKGQFVCAALDCECADGLQSW